jgi:hypothetical protein
MEAQRICAQGRLGADPAKGEVADRRDPDAASERRVAPHSHEAASRSSIPARAEDGKNEPTFMRPGPPWRAWKPAKGEDARAGFAKKLHMCSFCPIG